MALDAGQFGVALNRAGSALELEPECLEAMRLQYLAGVETLDQRVLNFGAALIAHPDASLEMKIEVLGTFLELGGPRIFSEAWEKRIMPQDREMQPLQVLHLRFLLRSGQLSLFFSQLQNQRAKAVDGSPDASVVLDLLEIEARYMTGIESDRVIADTLALTVFDRLLSEPVNARALSVIDDLVALLDLADPYHWTPEAARNLLVRLCRLPDGVSASPLGRLTDTLRLALHSDRSATEIGSDSAKQARDSILNAIIAERRSAGQVSSLADWLLAHGEAGKVLDLWEQGGLEDSPELYLSVMEALVVEERHREFHQLARFPPADVDRLRLEVLRALAFSGAERISAWENALRLADLDLTRNRFLWLAQAAIDAGEEEVALNAIVGASRHPLGDMPTTASIAWVVPALAEKGRFNDLLRVTQRLMRFDSSPVLLNNALYIEAVTGPEGSVSKEMLELVTHLVDENPLYPQIRSTAALLHTLAGREEDALAFYHDHEISEIGWPQLSEARKATLALVLRASDRQPSWEKLRKSIDWAGLSPPEREFFKRHLRHSEKELREP